MSSRHKLREMGMRALYQAFLLNKDIKQCVYDILCMFLWLVVQTLRATRVQIS